jgi:hypothetical protein
MAARSAAARQQSFDRSPSRGGVLDGRTLVARRRRQLISVYTGALGGADALTEGQRIDVRKAAELVALAEQERARAMREGTKGGGDLSTMIRLEGMAARAVKALNLPAPGSAAPVQSLQDYLASRHAAPDEAEE